VTRSYFELEDDLSLESRWHLSWLSDSRGRRIDGREFAYGRPVDLGPPLKAFLWNDDDVIDTEPPLRVSLYQEKKGPPLDFTYSNEEMPVVTSRVGSLLASVAANDIQRIPVRVESREEWYEIINITTRIDCIDRDKSIVKWFEPGNNVRPDLAGQPESVSRLVISPDRVIARHMFRVEGWTIALIVSDVVKMALEEHDVSGVRFRQVSP
jgi:hypothetical protein